MTESMESKYLLETVQFLQHEGYKVIFCALYGAQNYNLQREGSDYDYKAIVVPTLDDIVFNKKPTSETLDLPFNGQVDVKDIRLMVDQWKKGATNFLELLFSDWKFIHPDFPEMEDFVKNREAIAHANEPSAIKAMLGMMAEKFHAMTHPYPIQAEEIEKFGYAAKQLSHEYRLWSMISVYKTAPYAEVLNPFKGDVAFRQNFYDHIRGVKTRELSMPADIAIEQGKILLEKAKEAVKVMESKLEVSPSILAFMDEKKGEIVKRAIRMEIDSEA